MDHTDLAFARFLLRYLHLSVFSIVQRVGGPLHRPCSGSGATLLSGQWVMCCRSTGCRHLAVSCSGERQGTFPTLLPALDLPFATRYHKLPQVP